MLASRSSHATRTGNSAPSVQLIKKDSRGGPHVQGPDRAAGGDADQLVAVFADQAAQAGAFAAEDQSQPLCRDRFAELFSCHIGSPYLKTGLLEFVDRLDQVAHADRGDV